MTIPPLNVISRSFTKNLSFFFPASKMANLKVFCQVPLLYVITSKKIERQEQDMSSLALWEPFF